MRVTRLGKRKRNFFGMVMEFNKLILAITAIVFALGIISGIFMLNGVSNAEFERLFGIWGIAAEGDYKDGFFESIFKYGKTIFGIWLCGFFKLGIIGVIILIFAKGASIGFTSAFIVKCMGEEGIFMIFKLCFFRDLVIIFLCFTAGIFAVRKCIENKKFKEKRAYFTLGAVLFGGVLGVGLLSI